MDFPLISPVSLRRVCCCLLTTAISAASAANPTPEPPIPVPFVSAKTNVVSSKTVNTTGGPSVFGLSIGQSQAQRETSVSVAVKFFSPPPGLYDVQCFFLAKNEATKLRYIFNAVTHSSKTANTELEFLSGPLGGTTTNWIGLPSSTPAASGGNAAAKTNPNPNGQAETAAQGLLGGLDPKPGSKMDGWVVRIVYQGRVLKVDSNQPYLAEMAKSFPQLFDQAAKGQ